MEQKLTDAGLEISVIGVVPLRCQDTWMPAKSQQIYEWFVQNDPEFVEPFVVIDDERVYAEDENNWMFPHDQILVKDGWFNGGLKAEHVYKWMYNYHLNLTKELIEE
jgi:hypothetical protein